MTSLYFKLDHQMCWNQDFKSKSGLEQGEGAELKDVWFMLYMSLRSRRSVSRGWRHTVICVNVSVSELALNFANVQSAKHRYRLA